MMQNIYDNTEFFSSYKALRESDDNYNILLEQPAMMVLLPDLKNKTVIDLGCGFGDNCKTFINLGAKRVVGMDISRNMLEMAKYKNFDKHIDYIRLPLEHLSAVNEKFDLAYSSLCFHYIKEFESLIKDVAEKLNPNGTLLFSQEHPIVTASSGIAGYYRIDENGSKVYCLCNYQDENALRTDKWFIDGVVKYHRTFSTIINTLTDHGFIIEKVVEPVPNEQALSKRKELDKEFIKPTFLIVKATKKE
ncbi:MAG TPA: class I SAM-dependent methyltransferase [Candidatus Eubacterium faecavium]|nr:class I SAM-dependent methyltransferase [Candidatus Eubacterium faecavium]